MKIENKKAYIPCEIAENEINNGLDIRVRIDKTHDLYINRKLLIPDIDQPKPEVPQFVADWYEEHKEYLEYDLYLYQMSIYDGKAKKDDFYYWMQKTNNPVHKLINMHQFGYTVEKEKLYTVEIPNPNRNSKGCAKFRLEKLGDKVYLVKRKSKDVYQNKDSQKLTEAEIRKDFEWAWQWAKEVMK